MRAMKSWLMAVVLVAVAIPASAQSASGSDESAQVGIQIGLLRFNDFANSKAGFDVNYGSKLLTQPASSLGIRAGFVVEAGFHHFDGGSLKLFQGGVQLKADKVGTPRFKPYARILFGVANFDGGTDKVLSLLPGADITLPGHPFHLRVEIGQVWDIYDGGHQVAWRYSVGIAIPLK